MVRCAFWVTGFGSFAGVEDNPTEQLVRLLQEHLAAAESHGKSPAYRVLGTAVLEVAAAPAREWIDRLYHSCLHAEESTAALAAPSSAAAAAADDPDGPPLVVLHLGVDVRGDHFKLEQKAVNDATFRVPDQRGWRPQGQLIDDHPGLSLDTHLQTDLDVAVLAGRLVQQGFDAQPSQDAGRFVCNWTYYLSLLQSQQARVRRGRRLHALFLHVPCVEVVPLDRQFQLLLALLQALAEQLAPAAGEAAAGLATVEEAEVEIATESAAVTAVAEQVACSSISGASGGGMAGTVPAAVAASAVS